MFDHRRTYHQVNFQYTVKDTIDEREIHHYHEILYYIDGNTTFLCEHFQEKLEPGTLLMIPKEHYHCFRREQRNQFKRLKISFPDIPELGDLSHLTVNGIRLLKPSDHPLLPLLDRICKALSEQDNTERTSLFLYGAFLILFTELSKEKEDTVVPSLRENSHLITRCLKFIDENLTKDVSVTAIASGLHVSASTLSHAFKKELGISLHQYIMQKRLIYARNLIASKENPTKIYLACGYKDYSSFYKAYIKMFGAPPSNEKL